MNASKRLCCGWCFLLAGLMTAPLSGFQRPVEEHFELSVPGQPELRSTAVLARDRLTVTDARGRQFRYDRKPEYDSSDRQFLGFYSVEARQYLRWPVDGRGEMYGGTMQGGAIAWRRSSMQVRRVDPRGGGGGPVVAPRPVGPMQVALAPNRFGRAVIAHIDSAGTLQFYLRDDRRWLHREARTGEVMIPGAALALAHDPSSDLPLAYTINQRGELIEVANGRHVRFVAGRRDPRLIPGSPLAVVSNRGPSAVFVADDQGRLWRLDLERGGYETIERRTGLFDPAAALAVTNRGDRLFAVDRTGALMEYRWAGGRWSGPRPIARGFVSGASLALGSMVPVGGGQPLLALSVVDTGGRLRVFRSERAGWREQTVDGARLQPGASTAVAFFERRLHLFAIDPRGDWVQWTDLGGRWEGRQIASGFPVGGPIQYHASGPFAVAVDRTGRVVAGQLTGGRWSWTVNTPDQREAVTVVRRRTTANRPIDAVTVNLTNPHNEDLVIKVIDVRQPDRPIELKVPAGQTTSYKIERDSGAVLEEVFLIPGPYGELIEDVHRHQLPPQSLYDVVVYAERVTSVYFDRTTNQSNIPDRAQKSLVSLGVFPLPPGELLKEGATIDLYREALRNKNPGAAALVDPRDR